MKKLFCEGFTALDVAEPLMSFDAGTASAEARDLMIERGSIIAGVRKDGFVAGYMEIPDLDGGTCGGAIQPIEEGSIVPQTASLRNVIAVLAGHPYCFVSYLGVVDSVVTRNDLQKPPVRMWLFGMITILEMYITRSIEERFPNGTWKSMLSRGRLEKAREIQEERRRRNQYARLLDCLQVTDKAQILMKDPAAREDLSMSSRKEGEKAVKQFESLRNNLAHTQDIITYDWESIVAMAERLDRIMTRI